MTDFSQGRMLLSHNFDVSSDVVPALCREAFCAVFQEGLSDPIQCRLVNNPHWVVEVLFPSNELSPLQVGQLCAGVLVAKRRSELRGTAEVLVLGGIKTTPATSDSPDALQSGNWGVDVVETASAAKFLEAIAWEATTAQKPAESVFKVVMPLTQ